MLQLRKAWTWFDGAPRHVLGVRYLQIALGFVFLFRACTEGPYAGFLYSSSGIGQALTGKTSLAILLNTIFRTQVGSGLVVVLMGLAGVGLMMGYLTRLCTAICLIALDILMLRCPTIGDGGDNVCQLVLIYLLFVIPHGKQSKANSLNAWTHNVAVAAIGLQIIILYTTSGMMKATGERWSTGVAMYYISQVEWFSLPSIRGIFCNPIIVAGSTYIPLMYQIWFPVAIVSRLKIPWLFIGIFFHMGVAIFMGLITFSVVMIGLELFLISDKEYEIIANYITKLRIYSSVASFMRGAESQSALPPPGVSYDTVSTDTADTGLTNFGDQTV